jgi:hypothetical protein
MKAVSTYRRFVLIGVWLVSCGAAVAQSGPTVTVTSPTNGATFVAPANILLTAMADDTDGFVTNVVFLAGTTPIAEVATAPYSQVWTNVPRGIYQLRAVAIDNSNLAGVSEPVTITVLDAPTNPPPVPPIIVTQPQSQTVFEGENVTISVEATGTPPLLYRWQRDGVIITVTTNGFLNLFNVQTNQAGLYSVLVTNVAGFALSSNARLEVLPAPFTNRPPSFTKGPDITVSVAPFPTAYLYPHWATNIRSGPIGEPPQNLTFFLTTDNPALVGGLGIIPTTGDLQFSLSANTTGIAHVTVVLMDDGGTANGGIDQSEPQTFTITVAPTNTPPVAKATVSPLVKLFPDDTNLVVISPNNSNAAVVLDASLSSDADHDPLQFVWLEDAVVIAAGEVATNEFAVGTHTIVLVVDDGKVSSTDTVTFEVITASEAVDLIVLQIENSALPTSLRGPSLARLKSAMGMFENEKFDQGVHQLEAFLDKVLRDVVPVDPGFAKELIAAAEAIIDALNVSKPVLNSLRKI